MRSRRKRNSGSIAIAAVVVFFAPLLAAHEQKAALTDIFYNERSGNWEIAHRFSLHDAEHVVQKATGRSDDLTKSQKAREAFAKYVAEHFFLSDKNKKPIPLSLVGQEIDDGYLWVYQEAKIPEGADASFGVENSILLEVVRGQINTVNVRKGQDVTTFVFRSGSGREVYPDSTLSD